ncbi:MAG: peptide deformylase [Oscillospiraceae bacterium]|nr:peptide deformylase [Oscillospiraceae bacterium]
MALRTILTEGEPGLNKKSRKVERFDERLHQLLDDMQETLAAADGVGLAAPQVGVLRRAVLVDNGETVLELINPEILEQDGEQDGLEGCLSIPGQYGLVKRPMHVKVRAQDRNGNWYEAEGEGLTARCFCHEIEHLDGILYRSRAYHMLTAEELEQLRMEAEEAEEETP